MHKYVLLNDELLPAESASVSAAASTVLFGKSVFTTIALRGGRPLLWDKHWRRLRDHAGRVGLELSGLSEQRALEGIEAVLRRNEVVDGRMRVTLIGGADQRIWNLPSGGFRTGLMVFTSERRRVSGDLSLTLSRYPVNSRSPLAGIKSGNYLENLLALQEATGEGFDEALRLNERGEIVSASMANIFWSAGGELFTPALETGCLAGTIRELLLENIPVTETRAPLGELEKADEIFLTSSGIGVARATLGDKTTTRSTIHELRAVLRKAGFEPSE